MSGFRNIDLIFCCMDVLGVELCVGVGDELVEKVRF